MGIVMVKSLIVGGSLVVALVTGALVVPGARKLESVRVGADVAAALEGASPLDMGDFAGTLKPQAEYGQSAPASWRGAIRQTQARLLRPDARRPSFLHPGAAGPVVRASANTPAAPRALQIPALAR